MKRLLCLVLLLGLLIVPLRAALAHGGGVPRVVNQPIGPYVISVWSNPDPLAVGTAHISVALAQDSAPALDRHIWLVATPPAGEPISVAVTHAAALSQLYYEADLTLEEVGRWRFEVSVDDIAQTAQFEADVRGQSWLRSPWLPVAAVLVVGVAWYFTRNRGGKGDG